MIICNKTWLVNECPKIITPTANPGKIRYCQVFKQSTHKKLNFADINGQRFISCKSTVQFLDWYLQGMRLNPNLTNFKHAMSKYSKKIPKRTLSRSLRIEIAYRQSYKCNKCDYNFNLFSSLRLHIKRAHFMDDSVFVQCNI